jgi:hypothetical protein
MKNDGYISFYVYNEIEKREKKKLSAIKYGKYSRELYIYYISSNVLL